MRSKETDERRVGATDGSVRTGERCPECDGRLRETDGETCCTECGLVVAEDYLDRGPEWGLFERDHTALKRTGRALSETLHDRGLSTVIGHDPVDSGRKRRQLKRLRREQDRALFSTKAERNLAHALGEIARLTSALELPWWVRERASVYYRRAQCEGLIQGRSIEAIAAGSVYAACRCGGLPVTVEEVARLAQVGRSKVELGYAVLNRELGLAARVPSPSAYVPKLISAVDAPDDVRFRALGLAREATVAGMTSGVHPGGVAAACVYMAGHEHGQLYTQQQLAAVVDVTPTTLRRRVEDLRELLR